MQINLVRMWSTLKEFSNTDLNSEFQNIRQWWNDHDSGVRKWTLLSTSGSLSTNLITTAAAYTIGVGDQLILVNSTAGVVTATLPTAVGVTGKRYTVKDWKGQSAANNITIATTGGQTIDGAATKILSTNYAALEFVSDGANWAIISAK